jgi:hypothetical protein
MRYPWCRQDYWTGRKEIGALPAVGSRYFAFSKGRTLFREANLAM